jgi:hypothetical protein
VSHFSQDQFAPRHRLVDRRQREHTVICTGASNRRHIGAPAVKAR